MVKASSLPSALESLAEIDGTIGHRSPAFFLDFDGTLAPLASRPELVEVPPGTMEVLSSLAEGYLVCVISGRGLPYLRDTIGLDDVYYAADHGHRILGPPASGVDFQIGPEDRGQLDDVIRELGSRLRGIEGVTLEPKEISIAVHYRLVAEEQRPVVRKVVDEVLAKTQGFKVTEGKLVRELMPNLRWNKGHAVSWLLERLRLGPNEVCPLCLGDDLTDEDMFDAVRDSGVTVLIGSPDRPTRASYALSDSEEVLRFLRTFVGQRPGTLAAGVD